MRVIIKKILIKLHLYKIFLFILHYYFLTTLLYNLHKKYIYYIKKYKEIEHSDNQSGRRVLFLIKNPYSSLYLYPLMLGLIEKGYTIILKYDYRLISLLNYGANHILKLKHLIIKRKIKNEKFDILFYDEGWSKKYKKFQSGRYIMLKKYDKGNNADIVDSFYMPYPFHPDIYYYKFHLNTSILRKEEKIIRLFFSGNVNKLNYTKHNLEAEYNVINRYEIFRYISKKLDDNFYNEITQLGDFYELTSRRLYVNKLIALLTDWSQNQKENNVVKIPIDQWLNTLACADFFLACPGVQVPFSHNVIEAMYVGAIPVIQYGHLFSPPLEHMVNCIEYHDLDDLINKIKLILSLPKEEIQRMRENVFLYYNRYLDYSVLINNLINNSQNHKTLVLFTEYFKLWEQ